MEQNQIYATDNYGQMNPYGAGGPQPGGGKNKNGRYFCGGLVLGLSIALVLICGIYLANRLVGMYGKNDVSVAQSAQDKVDANGSAGGGSSNGAGNLLGSQSSNKPDQMVNSGTDSYESVIDDEMIQKLRVIEETINTYYYKEDIDREALMEGAFRGMVASLGDPYSEYYSEEELNALYQDASGIYYGIGAYVSIDTATNYPRITGVIENTPAEEAGIRENDYIYRVEGEDVYGLTLTEVVSRIKGEEGTYVNIVLLRDGREMEFRVQRRRVESPTVKSQMYENGIAYIQITEFDTVTRDQFEDALSSARAQGMKALILDLRSNPGGNLSTVVSIARMLLPKGIITYTVEKDGYRTEYKCDGGREIDVPMVVLVNGNSASASELLTGAIKDYGVGTIMGTTTFGKGIVQRPIELSDGSAIKLTISSYYTPSGVCIHGVGIEPDIVVEFNSERYYSDEAYDNQLEAAKEYLSEQLGY